MIFVDQLEAICQSLVKTPLMRAKDLIYDISAVTALPDDVLQFDSQDPEGGSQPSVISALCALHVCGTQAPVLKNLHKVK